MESNKYKSIKTTFFNNNKEEDMFTIKYKIDWEELFSTISDDYVELTKNDKSSIPMLKFLFAYYNSNAYKVNTNPMEINRFYEFVNSESEKAEVFRGFIFDHFYSDEKNFSLNKIKLLNDYLKQNNALDKILLERQHLNEEYDYSRADTTNIYLGLV